MKTLALLATITALMTSAASAETVGVSFQRFDDNFLAILRSGLEAQAKTAGVTLVMEDAQGDIARQQSQVENFIASGVDGIIVVPVEADAGVTLSELAAAAGIPIVFANNQPSNVDTLPKGQAFVGSDQAEAGGLEAEELCKRLGGVGNVVVLQGELGTLVARGRTEAVEATFKTPECAGIKIVEQQTANWSRTQALDLVSNWITAGLDFNGVIANNDEMALGAIQALKSAGKPLDQYVIAGIDATQDALVAMKAGDLDVTVFQDAISQGTVSLDTVLALAKGESVETRVFTTLELVTEANMNEYLNKN